MTDYVSADTDDLDAFVEHGQSLQAPLSSTRETLLRQRNYLLGSGLPSVVQYSEVATVDNTIGLMADLDRWVDDISTALRLYGQDLGSGVFRAPASTIDVRLDRKEDERLDALEDALQAEGLSPDEARRIRDEVGAILEYDPRFQIGGATVSEPRELAAAIVGTIEERAGHLIEDNKVTSSSLHAQPTLSVERLAADLYYGYHADEFVPYGALDRALRSQLTEDQYSDLQNELAELGRQEQNANVALVVDAEGEVIVDGDVEELGGRARELYDDNLSGPGVYGTAPRLNEPEIAYQLQKIAETDPARALGIKLMLDEILSPHERAELNRVLATGGTFGERVDRAFAHPRDGLSGAVKGAYNENFGWWADYWADAEVAIANGFYGMAANSTGSEYAPRVPLTWEENASIVELEFEMDNIAEHGGADAAFAIELASAAYGGGKSGLTLIRIGRRYFIRSGDELVASIGPELAAKLDEGSGLVVGGRRALDPSDVAAPVDDVVVIPESDYQRVFAPGRPDHAIDGNINGLGRGSGGHYLRSQNVRVTRTVDVAPNGVVRAETSVRDPSGSWIPKLDRNGDPVVTTFFPRSWSRRQTRLQLDNAFKNSHPEFTEVELPNHKPPPPPAFWEGRTSDGILIRGRYNVPGDPSQGWASAYPVFEGR